MIRLSASSLWRAASCPGSTVLPRIEREREDSTRGRELHAERETGAAGEEQAIAYNVLTGKARLLDAERRNYGALERGEIPGTADKVTVEADRVVVRDYKSGVGYMVAPPAENLQLHFYAVALAALHGKSAARVEVEYLETGHVSAHDMDVFALAAARVRIRDIWEDAAVADAKAAKGVPPNVVAGEHCWRCPCVPYCPAHREVLVAFGSGAAPQILSPTGIDEKVIAESWPIYQIAKRAMGEFEAAVRAYVRAVGPVPLADGRVLAEREITREQLDGKIALTVLRDLHGQDVAQSAATVEVTKKGLEAALATIAPPRGKSRLVKEALAAIAEAGGVTKKRSLTLDVYRPDDLDKSEHKTPAALPATTEAT